MGDVVPFPRSRMVCEPLLSLSQLASVIGYSPRWIRYRIGEGLPHTRLANGRLRFTLRDVEDWIENRETS